MSQAPRSTWPAFVKLNHAQVVALINLLEDIRKDYITYPEDYIDLSSVEKSALCTLVLMRESMEAAHTRRFGNRPRPSAQTV